MTESHDSVNQEALSPEIIQRFRLHLARKGMAINEQLTRLLAGQNARLLDLKMPHEQRPGLKPEEKLRMYLDQVIRAQRRLGTEHWGLCQDCGQPLPELALLDCPWLETCAPCESKSSEWL
ncbi:MAG TPA: hypothetical protein DCQ06_08550 [Myxococcales bacterium]|nr:hypothetical protein [Myxococcales bacterium]HAN31630.1 hypothetical protein [Myxococcales bacterium]